MAWGWLWPFGSGSKAEPLSDKQRDTAGRRCRAFATGLEGCRRANAGDAAAIACKNLELRLITCYAEQHAKAEAEEHRRCFTKLYTSGHYKGEGHCIPYEEAMKKALRMKGLYPV